MQKCEHLDIDLLMYLWYVDDSDMAVVHPPLGSKLVDDKLVVDNAKALEDQGRDRNNIT